MDQVTVATVISAPGGSARFNITTTVTNISRRDFTLSANGCPRRFRVEAGDGTEVKLSGQTCSTGAALVTLGPGEKFDYDDSWDGKDATGTKLAGGYRIFGQPFLSSGPQSEAVLIQLQ